MAGLSNAAVHSSHSMTTSIDQRFMRAALKLARHSTNRPSSEPLAGAIVVADGRVAGSGYAHDPGESAILAALDQAGVLARGATVYTNLAPCGGGAHNECLKRLIDSRIARIVAGLTIPADADLNAVELKSAGIEIEQGVLEEDCREVNEKYLKYSATGIPFVTVKFAQSVDGRIATITGDSQWISSTKARKFAHQLRREHDAITVGIGTVLADDPRLSVRLVRGRDPLRIIIDSRLRIPLGSRVLAEGAASHTLIVAGETADPTREREIEKLGAEVVRLQNPTEGKGIDLAGLLVELGHRKIASVLVEGGKGIITSLLKAGAVDRLIAVIAPKIIGKGTEAIGELGITMLRDAITFSSVRTRKLGPDIVFDARLK